jgi:hypothetical protein
LAEHHERQFHATPMIRTDMYVALQSLTMEPCSLTKENYAQARDSWLCTGCCVPKPEIRNVDVYLDEVPTDKPLNFVQGCGLSIIYAPFLDRFPVDIVQRDLHLGHVYGPDRQQLEDWLTFRGRRRVIVRGSEHAGVRKCEQCNRDVYFAMGKKYLHLQPPKHIRIFERGGGGGIVVRDDMYSQLDIGKWPKLRIDKLPVLDEPTDGFGILANP